MEDYVGDFGQSLHANGINNVSAPDVGDEGYHQGIIQIQLPQLGPGRDH